VVPAAKTPAKKKADAAVVPANTKPAKKKAAAVVAPAAAKPAKKKRNISPEGRKRITEAVKKRWAAQKAVAAVVPATMEP
jgi:hypothetical protein